MLDSFHTIVVGVDGTEESLAALSQARRLLVPGGKLIAVSVCEERIAVHAGFDAPRLADEITREAEVARARAAALIADLPGAEARPAHGRPVERLLAVAAEAGADLIAVGSRGHGRLAGILVGSVAAEILHRAPQSVLVARNDSGRYRAILVGVDGSDESLAALAVADGVSASEGARLRPVAAEDADPVSALVAGARAEDLIVVGSRRLRGLRALGSVSERVANRAPCSVLVVRGLPRTKGPSLDGPFASPGCPQRLRTAPR